MLTITLVQDLNDHPVYEGFDAKLWRMAGIDRGVDMNGLFVVTAWDANSLPPFMHAFPVESNGDPMWGLTLIEPFGSDRADHRGALEGAGLITADHVEANDDLGRVVGYMPPEDRQQQNTANEEESSPVATYPCDGLR